MPRPYPAGEDVRALVEPIHERQYQEGEAPWRAFLAFVSYPAENRPALNILAQHLRKSVRQLHTWSIQWSWRKRADALQRHNSRAQLAAIQAENVEMARRQAQMLAISQQALIQPVLNLVQKVQNDPNWVQALISPVETLQPDGSIISAPAQISFKELMLLVTKCVAVLPEVIAAERLARGLPTSITETRDSDGTPQPISDQAAEQEILNDPEAARLATELFYRIAPRLGA